MVERFDTVVVGSGFGGSVIAARLSGARESVCVLERGRPYPPGAFPRLPHEMARNVWSPRDGLFGLFDIWSFRRMASVVSSGLGGGSLIYANVLIRKDEKWFVQDNPHGGYEYWPITRKDLDPHYGAVEKILGATPYPFDREPYTRTPKALALRSAAQHAGLHHQFPNLAISFGSPPVPGAPISADPGNIHGRVRSTCHLCGECDVGCNYGSKNTLDHTYLSLAARHGAEIRTLAEVRRIDRLGGRAGGFRIEYHSHGSDGDPDPSSASTVTLEAQRLVLAAGTFGTPYLLLKNRAGLPQLSSALGTRFCGNGDLLTFLTRNRRPDDSPPWLDPSTGPVITGAIRVGDQLDDPRIEGRGFYIEDGGYPQFLNWVVEAGGAPTLVGRAVSFLAHRIWAHARGRPRSNVSRDIGAVLGEGKTSGTTMPLLAMGRDVPDGRMRLRHGDLDVDWTTSSSNAYFNRVEDHLDQIANALGARVMKTPLWIFKRALTVHPLGGCPMADDPRQGVVDSFGAVFGVPGLYVVDGSTMPGPVGPNPSLTIAAFADRAADRMLELSSKDAGDG